MSSIYAIFHHTESSGNHPSCKTVKPLLEYTFLNPAAVCPSTAFNHRMQNGARAWVANETSKISQMRTDLFKYAAKAAIYQEAQGQIIYETNEPQQTHAKVEWVFMDWWVPPLSCQHRSGCTLTFLNNGNSASCTSQHLQEGNARSSLQAPASSIR